MATAMEVFRKLPGTNCRECGEKSCLAFAGAVSLGQRVINDCPYLDQRFREKTAKSKADDEFLQTLEHFKTRLRELDFQEVAHRCGGKLTGDLLEIPVMGKIFGIRRSGNFATDLHIIPWLVMPLMEYLMECRGITPKKEWVSFRELKGGREKYALFEKRVESVLCGLADKNTDFFADIIQLFSAKEVPPEFASDVSVQLKPLPLVPVMISYWRPEEGMQSSLNLFFDRSVDQNLGVDSAFSIGAGLAQMLEKMGRVHGL